MDRQFENQKEDFQEKSQLNQTWSSNQRRSKKKDMRSKNFKTAQSQKNEEFKGDQTQRKRKVFCILISLQARHITAVYLTNLERGWRTRKRQGRKRKEARRGGRRRRRSQARGNSIGGWGKTFLYFL